MVSAEPKAQTKIREGRDDAGNPGPVYGQKDQAPNPRVQTTKKNKRQGRTQVCRYSWQSRAGQTPRRQINNQRKHQEEEEPRGKGKGGARTPSTGPKPDRERQMRKRSRDSGKGTTNQAITKKGGEALTVLSQSTARKVMYLQVTQ